MNHDTRSDTPDLPFLPDPNFPERQLLKYAHSFSADEPLIKTLVDMIPVGLAISSAGRNLTYANKSFANILGYTQKELEGIDWMELTYVEDREKKLDSFQKLLAGELDYFEAINRCWHKKGFLVWCNLRLTVLEDNKTGEKLCLAIIDDIQEKKQLSAELERQRTMLHMGEQVAGIGTFIWNMETQEVDASPELLRIYELDPETTHSKNLFEKTMRLVHPEDVENLRRDVMRSMSEKERIQSEFRIVLKGGRIKWLKSVPGAFLSDQHMLRTVQDITEEVERRKLLESQKEMIQMGEEVSSLGTFIWDVKTRKLEVSQGIYQIFDLALPIEKTNVTFELFFDLIFPEDIHKVVGMLDKISQTNKGESVEFRIKTPKGQVKWVKSYEGKFLDEHRRLATIQDVTLNVEKARLLERQKEMIEMGEGIAGFGTFVWNIKTREVIISPGLYLILGIEYKGEEKKESMNSFFSMIHPEDLDQVHNALQIVADKKESPAFVFRIYTVQGELKWVKAHKGKFLSEYERLSSIEDITENVKKTQLLERQKEMIEIGEKITGLGTFIWNVETREMAASSGLYHLFGLEEKGYDSKLFMDKFLKMIHPDDLDRVEANMKKISEEKNLKQIEFRIQKESGEMLWLRTSPGKFLTEKEKLGTLQDVTEDKEKTKQLERQAGMIRVGELTANVGTFVWDIHTHEIYASPGFYKCFGLKEDEIDGSQMFEACWNMVIPEDLHLMEARNKAIESGQVVENVDFRIRCPDGNLKWIRNYPGEFLNDHLKLGTIQDVTAEKQRTEQLRRNEEMVRLGQEVGKMGVDIWDLETGKFFYSPHLLSMFQINPEEVTDTNLLELLSQRFHPDDQKAIDVFTQKILKNPDEAVEMRHRIILNDGEIRWVHVISDRYIHPNTRITINKDITNFVLQREKLLDSQKEMEQLLYTVSHDLRAPVRHVSSYAKMVQKSTAEKLDEEEARYLSKVINASGRLGTMIDELLQFFRNKNIEMCRIPVDLGQISERTLELFSSETEKRGIDWQIGELPKVTGDPKMLEKVMLNLMSNAVKFTAKTEHPRIEVSAKIMGPMVLIQVIDNGAGFKMKYIDKLFAVFQRLHKLSDFAGTGIGLSNVKRIIERHGGSIWAEGEVGQGAKFYFTLPLAEERQAIKGHD